ncbi:DUF4907 domain-containing protein [Dyadobacter sp. LHD-138]|uniref:DUF4907 domain-containing protein n=1 Tax=Dyadobacter sp. LHD-138 TaxID=3071413 RepID=UPI0027DFD6EC|nr:DUF4907 domain-containing protein [Dyadobacter sp. LHD-138]MDQ6481589.1 DUF4907 domain-containing protein [Dyadobacter sp. LHD-138]
MIKKSIHFRIALICIWTFAVTIFISSCHAKKENANSEGLRNYKVSAIPVDSTWGYRIYQDTVAIIEQRVIPGLPGNSGFKTEQQALSVGELVISKLEKGVFPPSVSVKELDSLDIAYPH